MPEPLQPITLPEPFPYIPLKTWVGDGDLEKRHENGDVYITSHFWTSEVHEVETFGGSVIGDEAQDRLRDFITRRSGVWTDDPKTRKARWLEVVGPVGETDGHRPAYIETACDYMSRIPGVALDSCATYDRPETSDRVAEYGHATHVTLTSKKPAHFLILNSNDVLTITHAACTTINGAISIDEPGIGLETDHVGPYNFGLVEDTISSRTCRTTWRGVNAAIVLGRAMTEMVSETVNEFDMPAMIKYFEEGGAEVMGQELLVRHNARHIDKDLEQLVDLCHWLLDRRGLMRNQARKWLEVDIRVRLERVLYWCAETRLAVKEASELAESQLEKIKAVRAQEANLISAKRANSAVLLNRILATLTILTLICLPFTMTAAFYSMDANASTPHLFGKIVGSATGSLAVIVVVLIFIFRYWTEIRDARKARSKLAQSTMLVENRDMADVVSVKSVGRGSVASASIRNRVPTIDGGIGVNHFQSRRDLEMGTVPF